jgi:hypothetical protein
MIDPTRALAGLPAGLRVELIDSYRNITRNFVERRWEPSELNGGKFAEVVYTIVNAAVNGSAYPAKAKKPPNMAVACRALEGQPATTVVGDKSLRVYIPRALIYLYDIRNQRGVGHVGGDVDPNAMDASAVVAMASWVMAELVRIFHGVTTQEAQDTADALVERKTPLIWEVEPGGIKRVLDTEMGAKDQVLVFLHHSTGWVGAASLQKWVEYKNPTNFRDNVLTALHKARLIEFDVAGDRTKISPTGAADVEQRLLTTSSS